MGIKASILISAYQKESALPNVFESISRQKTDFDFEVCFVDDCSLVDPREIFYKHLNVKYKKGVRFLQHVGNRGGNISPRFGFINSMGYAFKMRDSASEIMILQSADVMWCYPDMLQKMVDGCKDGIIPAPCVKNMPVPSTFHETWEIDNLIKDSEQFDEYQGKSREVVAWLVPIPTKVLEEKDYLHNQGEYHITTCVRDSGYKYEFRYDMLGIHQSHSGIPTVVVASDGCLVNWGPNHPDKVLL